MTPIRLLPVVLALALAGCGGDAPSPHQPAVEVESRPNRPLPHDRSRPALQVTLVDGTRWDLAAQRGKWVVVNFWATWCGPCLQEMPELTRLAARDDVDVIGLAYEDIDVNAMQAFLAEHRPGYPIAIVDSLNPPPDFDTPRGLPMTVLIAPDGRIAKKVLGPVTIAAVDEAMARYRATGQG